MPHTSVMLNEVLQFMDPKDGEIYVDCTFGAGGYSSALLNAKNCKVYAIDRDPTVVKFADELAQKTNNRLIFISGKFSEIEKLLLSKNIMNVNGIVLDLGVSSMQLDQGERGFSFMRDAHLDMRMDQEGIDAYEVINHMEEQQLADIIYNYGEERHSRKIARKIIQARQHKPIATTLELAEIIRSTLGAKQGKIDSATRTFQAIRIYINDELNELHKVLESAEKLLVEGGRLVVVSFHSLEDSIVKAFLRERSNQPKNNISRYIPAQIDSNSTITTFSILTKQAIKPTLRETSENSRARSAKLRAAKRVNVL
ncbi:Ribosomal RNA small subunit methyltransferase H [Rickettsiales bacterium Ac37b]|nr:Ribosomal RNA small subunit methyltransferase H [Rickettsiales bacterium Ac37b]